MLDESYKKQIPKRDSKDNLSLWNDLWYNCFAQIRALIKCEYESLLSIFRRAVWTFLFRSILTLKKS